MADGLGGTDLAWETRLFQCLDREGLTVPVPGPVPVPTTDDRLFADGLLAMTYLDGGPRETQAAWEAAVCWDDDYAFMRLAAVRAV